MRGLPCIKFVAALLLGAQLAFQTQARNSVSEEVSLHGAENQRRHLQDEAHHAAKSYDAPAASAALYRKVRDAQEVTDNGGQVSDGTKPKKRKKKKEQPDGAGRNGSESPKDKKSPGKAGNGERRKVKRKVKERTDQAGRIRTETR
ncbi:uncharacterized protein [Macrobrachium rosenbergii]|uniref:uncharacterized protein n=1 Tax=Macrobrachium rosenbergii TaxID=79674 RepID=UPI0034D4681F